MEQRDHKYIFCLDLANGGRRAVVIDWDAKEATQRAHLYNPSAGWGDSIPQILTRVRRSMTSRVVAMED